MAIDPFKLAAAREEVRAYNKRKRVEKLFADLQELEKRRQRRSADREIERRKQKRLETK